MNAADAARSQAIALAAVLECAILVDQLARTGAAPPEEMRALTDSLFRVEWDAVEDVFGGVHNLARGLQQLEAMVAPVPGIEQGPVLRYAMSLLHLGKRLRGDRERLAIIRSRLQHTGLKSEHFATSYDELAASMAAIYQDTISTYRLRIQVTGSAQYLQDERVAARIRALLLVGVRAAVLWRFVGGNRLGHHAEWPALTGGLRKRLGQIHGDAAQV